MSLSKQNFLNQRKSYKQNLSRITVPQMLETGGTDMCYSIQENLDRKGKIWSGLLEMIMVWIK